MQEEVDDFSDEWLKEKYEGLGLVGLVRAKWFDPDYWKLRRLLDESGIDHGIPPISGKGLGAHVSEIFKMACDGATSSEIADRFGAKTKTVTRFCNRQGIELDQRLTLSDLIDDIADLATNGLSASEIASEIGFSEKGVRDFLRKEGLPVNNFVHKGHVITHNGYRRVRAPGHPQADAKGYVAEHRLVAEEKLGRFLRKGEIVHHKDGDKLNNALENLEVMSLSAHVSHHAQNRECGWGLVHDRRKKR